MQVSIETTSGLERRMTVTLPADRFDTEVNQRLRKPPQRLRLPASVPARCR
ncbi:MAG: trigger factor [Gammaproteobacteria bacterium]|nr:trigger factor [Gammaproteobacteria bacterium]